jgi:hypothetical protein
MHAYSCAPLLGFVNIADEVLQKRVRAVEDNAEGRVMSTRLEIFDAQVPPRLPVICMPTTIKSEFTVERAARGRTKLQRQCTVVEALKNLAAGSPGRH